MTAVEALTSAPLVEIARSLRRRKVSPLELVDAYTQRIERASGLHAFITPPGERARQAARQAERRLSRGEAGALLGVPIAVKDLFATRAIRTTAGSRILKDWVPSHDAAAVARLKEAGAIIFGKTNLHEFAYGVSTANPWWGVARNPHDPTRSPGGSSGGSTLDGTPLGDRPAVYGLASSKDRSSRRCSPGSPSRSTPRSRPCGGGD